MCCDQIRSWLNYNILYYLPLNLFGFILLIFFLYFSGQLHLKHSYLIIEVVWLILCFDDFLFYLRIVLRVLFDQIFHTFKTSLGLFHMIKCHAIFLLEGPDLFMDFICHLLFVFTLFLIILKTLHQWHIISILSFLVHHRKILIQYKFLIFLLKINLIKVNDIWWVLFE